MEAARVRTVRTERAPVFQDEGDLDDPRGARRHQGVSEHRVDHRAEREGLGVPRHSVSGEQDNDAGDQVALRAAVSLPAQPEAQQTGAPPHNAHRRVLEIVVDPRLSPAMLCERVNTPPGRDDQRVEEFLAPACAAQPVLADEQ